MSRLSRKAFLQALASLPCLAATGCASWFFEQEATSPPPRLPHVPIPPDVIVAEVSLIRVREPQLPMVEEAWRLSDEQIIPISRRRDLDANGFRCGHFGGEVPKPLRNLLQIHEEQIALDREEGEGTPSDTTLTGLRMQLRAARRGEIRVRSAQGRISVLLSTGGVVRGGDYADAACSFLIRGYPSAAASAEIELTPYIEYGLPKREWLADDGEISMSISRPKEEFAALRMNAQLGPGDVLLVGPNSPPKGLGGVFFHERPNDPAHGLLLIRLALSQSDPVFQSLPTEDAGRI